MAERIKRSFGTTPHLQKIKLSIGLVDFDPQCDLTNFVKRTDEAMYTAQKMGGNQIYLLSKGWQLDLGVGKGFEDSRIQGFECLHLTRTLESWLWCYSLIPPVEDLGRGCNHFETLCKGGVCHTRRRYEGSVNPPLHPRGSSQIIRAAG